jgi:molybdopterin molybdotransferase
VSHKLLSVAEARTRLLSAFSVVEKDNVPLIQATGRVLCNDIVSEIDLPNFHNSSMDGFAVRSIDVRNASSVNPISLSIVADIPAGKIIDTPIDHSKAARIMTGAPMPPGADAVVPIEDTDQYRHHTGYESPYLVHIYRPVQPGEFIRLKGQDVSRGDVVLKTGVKLRPQDIGYLAMLGMSEVSVFRKPRVAIMSTGDELLPVGVPIEPGKVYDSNAFTLSALVERDGGIPIYFGTATDQEEAIRELMEKAVSQGVDLILSTAGVSVGAFDYVRRVVEQFGKLSFWRVNMRPGKPLLFGHYHEIPFFGLPGNPVSAFMGFEVFVRPALLKLIGISETQYPVIRFKLLESVESDGRESYLRAIVTFQEKNWVARLAGHQGSGNFRSLVQANALLIIPSGVKSLPVGSEVEGWLLDDVREP